MHKYLKTTAILFLLSFIVSPVFSATLQVTKIGALDLGGKVYPEWWYTAENPLISGKAAASSDVSIKIGTTTATATSNASGDWSYQTALAKGDYDMEFTQGSEKVSFKLHLGQDVPSNLGTGSTAVSQSTGSVPVTGSNQTIALSLGIGLVLLASYFYVFNEPNRKRIFETKIIRED
jgi:hypothetical protein